MQNTSNRTASVSRVQDLRSSNAAVAIPSRKVTRQGSRSGARKAAIRNSGW